MSREQKRKPISNNQPLDFKYKSAVFTPSFRKNLDYFELIITDNPLVGKFFAKDPPIILSSLLAAILMAFFMTLTIVLHWLIP